MKRGSDDRLIVLALVAPGRSRFRPGGGGQVTVEPLRHPSMCLMRRFLLRMSRRVSVLFGLVLLVLSWHNAYGQSDCPFPDSMAVADTLDPKGYFPLQAGNVWEYETKSGSFLDHLREQEVVADTLIDSDMFYKIREVIFDPIGNLPIMHADTVYSFKIVLDGILFRWTPQQGRTELAQLFRDFNTCYDIGSQENAAVVEGVYDTTFTFILPGIGLGASVEVAAIKEFGFFGLASEVYSHGLGLIRSEGDPSVRMNLTFARIDGQEHGTPLDSLFDIRVSTADHPADLFKSTRLDVYPNPSNAAAQLSLTLAHPGSVTVKIYDLLGRRIDEPLRSAYLQAGKQAVAWSTQHVAPGVYFVHVVQDGRIAARTRLVVTR